MPHRPKYSGADLREIRTKNGVGRPIAFVPHSVTALAGVTWDVFSLHAAVCDHGSQRAAARWLGMNLSTFQRRLTKEAAR